MNDALDDYQNEKQKTNNQIALSVVIRVRPLTEKQQTINKNQIVQVIDSKRLLLIDPESKLVPQSKKIRKGDTTYQFDYVYGKTANTKEIYDQSISNSFAGLFDGFNATVLTYGPTGCGKTFTMIGQNGNEGILPLAMIDILGRVADQKRRRNVFLKLCYLEIYNQNIKDLLIAGNRNFEIRQDVKQGIQIPGITQIMVNSLLELNTVLKIGNKNRSKQTTQVNEVSSRSHAILMVKIETKQKHEIDNNISSSRLCLVDLAGSERVSNTMSKGTRLTEGAKINKSLLTLGNCIQILSQNQKNPSKQIFVPFRDSKLTRLLKESLGGNCRTTLISNISPFNLNFQDTYNTLQYCNRAKSIKTMFKKNQLSSQNHICNYLNLIGNLKRQNDELRRQAEKNHLNKHSLPLLKNNLIQRNNSQMIKLESNINSHFEQQFDIAKKKHEFQMKVDKMGFKMLRLELENDHSSKQYQKIKQNIEDITAKIVDYQRIMQSTVQKRSLLIQEIKASTNDNENYKYLMAIYKEKKVQLQIATIKMREDRFENQNKEKQMVYNYFKMELKKRDKIIEQQKIVLKKNNIINRITYSKLNKLSDFDDHFIKKDKAQLQSRDKDEDQITTKLQKKNDQMIRAQKKRMFEDDSLRKISNFETEEIQNQFMNKISDPQEKKNNKKKPKQRSKNIYNRRSKNKNSQFDFVYIEK